MSSSGLHKPLSQKSPAHWLALFALILGLCVLGAQAGSVAAPAGSEQARVIAAPQAPSSPSPETETLVVSPIIVKPHRAPANTAGMSAEAIESSSDASAIPDSVISQMPDPPTPLSEEAKSPGKVPGSEEDSPVAPGAPVPSNGVRWESTLQLVEIVESIQDILPETWEVSVVRFDQLPRKWEGVPEGIYVKVEDPSIIVHHPNGFEYHPFYKLWLCPPRWVGRMEDVRYTEENGQSVLLGQNHKMKVFYLTLGANNWPQGPGLMREALDLTALPITTTLRQQIEPSMMVTLFPRYAVSENGRAGLLGRVVGLEKEGPLAYVEYATATDRKLDGHILPSRCKEPAVTWLMERENLFLAKEIFMAYPDVQTVYLRRVCDEFMSDRIINRSDETSESRTILSDSSH